MKNLNAIETKTLDLAIEWSLTINGKSRTIALIESGDLILEFKNAYQAFYKKASKLDATYFKLLSQNTYLNIFKRDLSNELQVF